MIFESFSTFTVAGLFAAAGMVIFLVGLKITDVADNLADRTGLGEAVVGGILLGAATSLSGTVVSVTAALDGAASLAFSNAIGGIAAQTAFLALADIVHRKANLEHSAAEATTLFQSALLIVMLSLPLVACLAPETTIWQVHPVSIILVALYCVGAVASREVRRDPMWRPVRTRETRTDTPDDEAARASLAGLLIRFSILVVFLGLAGWVIARTGSELSTRLGLSQTVVGALMTAVVTSLPELVTTIAAVRRGAIQLAVGGIIGGNTFDVLFLSLSDLAYRDGSLYHAVQSQDLFWLAIGLLMGAILLLGLILRQKRGPLKIGVESIGLLAVYGGAVAIQVSAG